MCERAGADGPQDGDAVAIYDRRHRFVGRGLFNGRSQIGCRVLDPGGEGEDLGAAFFAERIAEAARLRRDTLHLPRVTDAYRLVNSEGDGLSGLIIDIFGAHASCEVLSLGMWQRRAWIEEAIRANVPEVVHIHWRSDERLQDVEGFRIPKVEGADTLATVTEHGVRFGVDLELGHKTGFFCDQRDNRLLLSRLVEDKRVLDLCCYTGGFALYASVLGKAREVTAVDLDEKAIARAEENVRLNELEGDRAPRLLHQNAFHFLKGAPLPDGVGWDVVVLDPPKLARTRADVPKALRDYYDLNRLALRAVRPGGLLLTCSCSGLVSATEHLEMIGSAAFEADKRIRTLGLYGPGPDHPIDPSCPEGIYLKTWLLEVR